MSEVLDKQVRVLNECFKYKFWDSRGGHASPRKVCNENKERKKQLPHKKILMEGRTLYGYIRSPVLPISMNFRSTILHTLKVLFV